jgi:hypothetical protein
MTMNGLYNFTIFQGETVEKTFIWYDVNKQLQNLTGYAALFHLYNPKSLATILDIINTGTSPGIVLGGTAGTIALTITAAQTDLLTFDFASYYLRMVVGTPAEYRFLLAGTIMNRRK